MHFQSCPGCSELRNGCFLAPVSRLIGPIVNALIVKIIVWGYLHLLLWRENGREWPGVCQSASEYNLTCSCSPTTIHQLICSCLFQSWNLFSPFRHDAVWFEWDSQIAALETVYTLKNKGANRTFQWCEGEGPSSVVNCFHYTVLKAHTHCVRKTLYQLWSINLLF